MKRVVLLVAFALLLVSCSDITTEEEAALYNAAYQEGYEAAKNEWGYSIEQKGRSEGHSEGYNEGYDIGYEEGYEEAKRSFYDEGYVKGYHHGYDDGWEAEEYENDFEL